MHSGFKSLKGQEFSGIALTFLSKGQTPDMYHIVLGVTDICIPYMLSKIYTGCPNSLVRFQRNSFVKIDKILLGHAVKTSVPDVLFFKID